MASIHQATHLQDADLVEGGRCVDTCFTASMLTNRGRCQKFCQLLWATMIPAFALAIYSTADFVQSVSDYRSRQRDLRPRANDIQAASTCIRTIRSVQLLRLSATMFLASGDVDGSTTSDDDAAIIEDYIRSSFDETLKLIDLSRAVTAARSAGCDFASVLAAFDSEVSTPLRILFTIGDPTASSTLAKSIQSADGASASTYCTIYDYVAARMVALRNLTLTRADSGGGSGTGTDLTSDGVATFQSMTNLIDLLRHDCFERIMVYSGRRLETLTMFQTWISLAVLEEAYSALDLLGALHFLTIESGRNAVQLRVLAISYDRQAVDAYRQIQETGGVDISDIAVDGVRSTIRAVIDDKEALTSLPPLLTPKFARQQSFVVARWISQLQDALEILAQATDETLTDIDRMTSDERRVMSSTIGLDIFVWILVFVFLCPLVTINADRNMQAVKAYTNSFESKEHELKMEKRKTEALLGEMLPRSVEDAQRCRCCGCARGGGL